MRINELNHEMHYRRAEFTGLLALIYLPGVGTVVGEHFIEAMRGHQADISGPSTARSFHDYFRAHSAALTRPREIAQITSQPPRNLAT